MSIQNRLNLGLNAAIVGKIVMPQHVFVGVVALSFTQTNASSLVRDVAQLVQFLIVSAAVVGSSLPPKASLNQTLNYQLNRSTSRVCPNLKTTPTTYL